MAEIATLLTIITADTAQFTAALDKAKAEATSFSGAISAGGLVAVAAFTAMAGAVVYVGDEILKSADKIKEFSENAAKIGTTTSALQELTIAAGQTGVSAEQLQTSLGFMNTNLGKAQLGTGTAVLGLKALGISLSDIKGLSADQTFTLIASKLALLKDNIPLETAVASSIFGKGAKADIALFNSNIDDSRAKIQELGITMSDSQAEALTSLAKSKDLIGTIWEGFKDNVSADVAPAFQELLTGITQAIVGMGGMKQTAKDTATSVVSFMRDMTNAALAAVEAFKYLHSVGNDLSKLAFGNIGTARRDPSSAKKYTSDDQKRDNGQDAATQAAIRQTIAAQTGLAINTDATTRAINAYKDTHAAAAKALETMKKSAESTAEVLDKFHKIQDDFAAPGKTETDLIVKNAVNAVAAPQASAQSTSGTGRTFQGIYDEILKLRESADGQRDVQGNTKADIPKLLGGLQDIITGANSSTHPKIDTSGLTGALNELKSFLGSKAGAGTQTVNVNIQVTPTDKFTTQITTSQTFKQAVDAEFKEKTASAAQGNLP